MTGRELIMYILQNGLEDKPVVDNGKLMGFLTVDEAAAKFNVGHATVLSWVALELVDAVSIGDVVYIPDNIKVTKETGIARVYHFRK